MPGHDLAVDYGTSNTVATLRWPDGRVRPLIFDGSPQLPSAVWLADDARLLTGGDAVRSARFDPARYEPHPKRRVDELEVLLGTAPMPVERLVAATLARVATEAARTFGTRPDRVVLTHPVVWGPARRSVLIDAARSIGLTNVFLVPEPVAAATYLATVTGHVLPDGSNVLVYDLGAGTFDATLVTRRGGEFVTLAYRGLEDVGGLDFDAVIIAQVGAALPAARKEAWQRILAPTEIEARRHNRALWEDVKNAKELLSREASTGLHLAGLDQDTILTRDEFEAGATALINRTVEVTTATLRESRIRPDQLSAVFLVGGGSRMPLVATLLHRAIGIAPTVLEQPEIVVAEGGLRAFPAARPAPLPTPAYPPLPVPPPNPTYPPYPPPPNPVGPVVNPWVPPVAPTPVPQRTPQPVPADLGNHRSAVGPGQPGAPVPQPDARPPMNRIRLAFEAGRTTAAVCQWDPLAAWYAGQLGEIFGPGVLREFNESHARLRRPGHPELFYAEQARWRARFAVLLEEQPQHGSRLGYLVAHAADAVRQASTQRRR